MQFQVRTFYDLDCELPLIQTFDANARTLRRHAAEFLEVGDFKLSSLVFVFQPCSDFTISADAQLLDAFATELCERLEDAIRVSLANSAPLFGVSRRRKNSNICSHFRRVLKAAILMLNVSNSSASPAASIRLRSRLLRLERCPTSSDSSWSMLHLAPTRRFELRAFSHRPAARKLSGVQQERRSPKSARMFQIFERSVGRQYFVFASKLAFAVLMADFASFLSMLRATKWPSADRKLKPRCCLPRRSSTSRSPPFFL